MKKWPSDTVLLLVLIILFAAIATLSAVQAHWTLAAIGVALVGLTIIRFARQRRR